MCVLRNPHECSFDPHVCFWSLRRASGPFHRLLWTRLHSKGVGSGVWFSRDQRPHRDTTPPQKDTVGLQVSMDDVLSVEVTERGKTLFKMYKYIYINVMIPNTRALDVQMFVECPQQVRS